MKRAISIILMLCLCVSVLSACGAEAEVTPAAAPATSSDGESLEQDTTEADQQDTEVDIENELPNPEPVIEEPVLEPEPDPYDVLKMEETLMSYINNLGGSYYLLRDGNYYSLSRQISLDKSAEYQVGMQFTDVAWIYAIDAGHLRSLGNIPVVTIEQGDSVVSYGLNSLKLTSATLAGYSIPLLKNYVNGGKTYRLVLSPDNFVDIPRNVKQFEMVDSRGNAVPQIAWDQVGSTIFSYQPDLASLVKDETYTISWFEGTTYHEYQVKADSPYYSYDDDSEYKIEGELHKEGYASYDFSDVPPGLYMTEHQGIFCIPE